MHRFAKFFGTMGFAGAVELHTGNHLNDFDNYGIKILVKYRDSEPLQVGKDREFGQFHWGGGVGARGNKPLTLKS